MKQPDRFLNLVVHEKADEGDNLALCAGYERGVWRKDDFANHVMEWLPEFALNHSEIEEIGHHNAIKMIKKAAKIVYQTEKYGARGEFGELFLHIAIRQVYQTLPAVSKIYYKSTANETVKGFDAVHVVKKNDVLELWIVETKFYTKIVPAINDVCKEIIDHLETDYLRSEFILIQNKIDPMWPEAESLKTLLDSNTTLDQVFKRACIPILLTYDSKAVQSSKIGDEEYVKNLKEEIQSAYENLRSKLKALYSGRFSSELPITVHVILIPLEEKKQLIEAMDLRLKALQL